MATEPKTYRISPEVDAELRKLAKEHGGVDRALRATLDELRKNPKFQPEGRVADSLEALLDKPDAKRLPIESWRRGPRQKGDKGR